MYSDIKNQSSILCTKKIKITTLDNTKYFTKKMLQKNDMVMCSIQIISPLILIDCKLNSNKFIEILQNLKIVDSLNDHFGQNEFAFQ